MSEDEDWFERALRELDEEEERPDRERTDEATASDDGNPAKGTEQHGETGDGEERHGDTGRPESSDASEGPIADDSSGSSGTVGRGDPDTTDSDERDVGVSGDGSDGGGDAVGDASANDGAFGDDGFDGNGAGSGGFGGDSFGGGPSGAGIGGADPDDGSIGDDVFGGADDFGFADFGAGAGGGPETFDDAELDSDIERISLGIEGLDEMILGGVPRRSLITAIGAAGTGKTTFGLQFLDEGLRNGDRAIYITLEESREAILSTAEEKGWPFREYESEGLLAVVALDPVEMANSLNSIRNDLSRLITEFGAERLVLDSVSLLEMMYDHPAERRSEVFDFTRSLKDAGVTTMLTSEANEENPYASRHGIVEYLTDAVFILQYVRPSDFRETRLAVEIQKIRDANHSRETKPYEITDDGISVYRQANIF